MVMSIKDDTDVKDVKENVHCTHQHHESTTTYSEAGKILAMFHEYKFSYQNCSVQSKISWA